MIAQATAQLVHALHRAGIGSRPRMVPREIQPDLVEAAYAKQLVAMVGEWRAEIEPLLRDVPEMLRTVRHDDVPEYARVRSSINRVREVAYRQATRVRASAQRTGREASDFQKRQLDRQLKAGLGVEVPIADRKAPTRIERFVERNVSEMQSLSDKTTADVQRLVLDAFDRGARPEELAAEIHARFDIAENKARFIAGNQLSKLSSQVRRDRHVEIGITTFKWVTRNDGKVRESHAVKHGRIFPYEGSRAPSFFPGEEYNCRCLAMPVLDEIKGKAAELAGKGKNRRYEGVRTDAEESKEMRVAILGGPRCGKTTFAATLGEARHTDDVMALGWSEASDEVATWFDASGPWIIEGVAVPRALRKWLAAHPEDKPCDVVHAMFLPHVELTSGQAAMLKGCAKVWDEIAGELRRRGVEIL